MDKKLQNRLEETSNRHELLSALLYTANDEWENAHEIAQQKEGELDYDRIHALLHRIEGDDFNARYWYRRINETYAAKSIQEEWKILTEEYIEKYS